MLHDLGIGILFLGAGGDHADNYFNITADDDLTHSWMSCSKNID